jgi:Thioesterase domain
MKTHVRQLFFAAPVLCAAVFLATGCAGFIPARSSEAWNVPGNLSEIHPVSNRPRIGQVILLRGILGVWSRGIDELAAEVNAAGIHATVFKHSQWESVAGKILESYKPGNHPEPLVLIGHSLGSDDALHIAEMLKNHGLQVDLLITFDPVNPPQVPGNVRTAVNYYQSRGLADAIPVFRGIYLEQQSNPADTRHGKTTHAINGTEYLAAVLTPQESGSGNKLQNINLTTSRPDLYEPQDDHFNIDENRKIHREIIGRLLQICPPRAKAKQKRAGNRPARR